MSPTTRILVVDDDPAVLQIFALILRKAGYRVLEASTGQEALQLTRRERPNLVLLDVVLPDLSGVEVCRQIKAEATLADVFVVLISGQATTADCAIDGLETGADEYLCKPIAPSEFLARVRTIARLQSATVALKASEQYHRRLVEILPDAVAVLDLEGRVTALNQRAAAMLGYDSPLDLLGVSAPELASPECRARAWADLAAAARGEVLLNSPHTLLKRDGTPFPVEVNATAFTDSTGQSTGVIVATHDVTERKRREDTIQDLLSILDRAQDAIIVCDLDYRVQFFSQGAERLCGYNADEARGRRVTELYQVDAASFKAASRKALRDGAWQGELDMVTKTGERIVVDSRWTLVRGIEGKPNRLVNIATNITEAKRVQRQLVEVQELNEAVLAASFVGIQVYRASGECVFANQAASRITGGTIEGLLHQNFRELASWRTNGVVDLADEVLQTRETRTCEVHSTTSFGKDTWVDCSLASFVRNTEPHLLVMLVDITERKRAETVMRQLPGHILKAQEAERLHVARELHDGVNQILASARMRLIRVTEDLGTDLRPAAREILRRCGRLLLQALEQNRRIAHNLRPTDLDELGLASACRNLCKELRSRSNLTVKHNVAGLTRRLSHEVELNLFRVVQEGLANVEKHAHARTIRLHLATRGDSIILQIKDDGCGRDASRSRSAKPRSRGIGLANMRERVAALGGSFAIESARGKGTIIAVCVPCRGPHAVRSGEGPLLPAQTEQVSIQRTA